MKVTSYITSYSKKVTSYSNVLLSKHWQWAILDLVNQHWL